MKKLIGLDVFFEALQFNMSGLFLTLNSYIRLSFPSFFYSFYVEIESRSNSLLCFVILHWNYVKSILHRFRIVLRSPHFYVIHRMLLGALNVLSWSMFYVVFVYVWNYWYYYIVFTVYHLFYKLLAQIYIVSGMFNLFLLVCVLTLKV